MTTTLDSIIARLEELRNEVGGDCHVRIRETKSVNPGYLHPIDHIGKAAHMHAIGEAVQRVEEIQITPYLAP